MRDGEEKIGLKCEIKARLAETFSTTSSTTCRTSLKDSWDLQIEPNFRIGVYTLANFTIVCPGLTFQSLVYDH